MLYSDVSSHSTKSLFLNLVKRQPVVASSICGTER